MPTDAVASVGIAHRCRRQRRQTLTQRQKQTQTQTQRQAMTQKQTQTHTHDEAVKDSKVFHYCFPLVGSGEYDKQAGRQASNK